MKKTINLLLAIMLCSSFCFYSFSIEVPGPIPQKPKVSSYENNDLIQQYNQKVEIYNNKVKEYNQQAKTANLNNERQYNNTIILNKKIKEETDKQNEKIKKQNEQMKLEIDNYNKQQQLKKEKSIQAREDAIQRNKDIEKQNQKEIQRVQNLNKQNQQQYERALQQAEDNYNSELEEYNNLYQQYEKDLYYEQLILNNGYESVESYNQMIENNYNKPANTAVERNKTADKFDITKTIKIKESQTPSEQKVSVYVTHEFDNGDSYSEELEIDANDIITFYPASNKNNAVSENSAIFYLKTDNDHLMGYWSISWTELQSNAVYSKDEWNCGDVHIVSYKDGINHPNDSYDIIMTYHYAWNPLKVHKIYNIPKQPTYPVKKEILPPETIQPTLQNQIQIPDIYTPQYKMFIPLEELEYNYIEIPKNISKLDYILPAPYLNFYKYPKQETPINHFPLTVKYNQKQQQKTIFSPSYNSKTTPLIPNPIETKITKSSYNPIPEKDFKIINNTDLPQQSDSKSKEELGADLKQQSNIKQQSNSKIKKETHPFVTNTDLASPNLIYNFFEENNWSLLNLILIIVSIILSFSLFILAIWNKRKEKGDLKINNNWDMRILSFIISIFLIIIFYLLEDFSTQAVFINIWTIPFSLIFILQLFVIQASRHTQQKRLTK